MQLKNLIFVFSLTASALTTVLGAAPEKHDYKSFKSCVSGNFESCPDFKQLYRDESHYKENQQTLHKCMSGKKEACKEWEQKQPEGKSILKRLKGILKLP